MLRIKESKQASSLLITDEISKKSENQRMEDGGFALHSWHLLIWGIGLSDAQQAFGLDVANNFPEPVAGFEVAHHKRPFTPHFRCV